MPFMDLSILVADVVTQIEIGRLSLALLYAIAASAWLHASPETVQAAGLLSQQNASEKSLRKAQVRLLTLSCVEAALT
jgi:hypothetical protein